MPGAHVPPVYDSLYRSSIDSVLVKHEQGAAFMAGGYARISHRVSACIATAGPGATNLITGIANAYAEQLPVLVITGETSTHIFGRGGLQGEFRRGRGHRPERVVPRHHPVSQADRARTDSFRQVLNQATMALFAEQAGPALLSIPYNVQKETVDEDVLEQVHWPRAQSLEQLPVAPVAELAQLIEAASNPVIVAGYGCIKAGARGMVAMLSQGMGIPVATSLKGKGRRGRGHRPVARLSGRDL